MAFTNQSIETINLSYNYFLNISKLNTIILIHTTAIVYALKTILDLWVYTPVTDLNASKDPCIRNINKFVHFTLIHLKMTSFHF